MPDSAIYALALATPVCAAAGYGLWAINQKVSQLQSGQGAASQSLLYQTQAPVTGTVVSGSQSSERPQALAVLSPLEVGQSLTLCGPASKSLLEVSRVETSATVKCKDMSLTPETKARLGRVVQNVLGEGGRTALARAGTYVLKFSPEVTQGLRDGTLELIRNKNGLRAIVRHTVGKKEIAANAVLEGPGLVGSPASVCLLGWQIAAAITAQKYLADIDQKLSSLENLMNEVLHWLEDQERGVLLGNYHYLSRIRSALNSQECTEIEIQAFSSQLEHIDRECLQVQYAADQRLKRIESEVVKHNEKKISAEQSMEEAKQLAQSCNRSVQVVLMTLQIRCLTLELKAAMSASHNLLQSRLEEMKLEYTSLQKTFRDCVEPLSKVPDFNNMFGVAEKKKMYEGRVNSLKLQAEKDFAEVMHSKENQLGYLERTLQSEIRRAQDPLELRVQMGEGGELLAIAPVSGP